MSKLFDALEKIQEQEDTSPQVEQVAKPQPTRKTGRYFPFLVGLTVIAAIVVATQYIPVFKNNLFQQSAEVQTKRSTTPIAPDSQISHATSPLPQKTNLPTPAQVEYFNNHGVELIEKGDAWDAIYYFDKASKLAPEQPEPLINMGVILAQLDLGFPAGRVFKKAYHLAPHNEHLHQAIDLAIAEQVLPPDFPETIPVSGMDGN